MTKHTTAYLKILVGPILVIVFCQNKESKLSANISHQKILMKQGVILIVFLWYSQQQQLQNFLRI